VSRSEVNAETSERFVSSGECVENNLEVGRKKRTSSFVLGAEFEPRKLYAPECCERSALNRVSSRSLFVNTVTHLCLG
jgi:hypothetical protein